MAPTRAVASPLGLSWLLGLTLGAPPQTPLGTFPLRYILCDGHWRPRRDGRLGPLFFYAGNEAAVEVYVNHTGLLWETAAEMGALVVFAEHRYYGKSQPFGADSLRRLEFLTTEHALGDYASLIAYIKAARNAADAPVIAFGGSYGGLLASWMRLHFPWLVDGAISSSAPAWAKDKKPVDAGAFARIVTRELGEPCAAKLRSTWPEIFERGRTPEGREELRRTFRLCPAANMQSEKHALVLALWLQLAFDVMAMSNYPFPSAYFTSGDGFLPAFPLRAACALLGSSASRLEGLRDAAGLLHNASGDKHCFTPLHVAVPWAASEVADVWHYQGCTELSVNLSRDGVSDAFWAQPWDLEDFSAACQRRWGVRPRHDWAVLVYGGRQVHTASNIVFSNGALDPWASAGVTTSTSKSVIALLIPDAAHHHDLMFSHPLDPRSVIDARALERREIARWLREAYARSSPQSAWTLQWLLDEEVLKMLLAAGLGAAAGAGALARENRMSARRAHTQQRQRRKKRS